MGYPMTWKRVVNRNALSDGGYNAAPEQWQSRVNTIPSNDDSPSVGKVRRERLAELENKARLLAGDIRRLEQDARDEQNICAQIASRTGISKDDVAAVLKEFFDL